MLGDQMQLGVLCFMKTHGKTLETTSKFLSYVLRHQPQAIGLQLDSEGWANIDELIVGAARQGKKLDKALIHQVVASNDKQRFALSDDGQNIRAVQGHSTTMVQRQLEAKVPPRYLYHGTATRFIDSIFNQGLLPGNRHYVHLSLDEKTALKVGQRHGKPVVLAIRALLMHENGFFFYQAENGVWLTKNVPVEFVSKLD